MDSTIDFSLYNRLKELLLKLKQLLFNQNNVLKIKSFHDLNININSLENKQVKVKKADNIETTKRNFMKDKDNTINIIQNLHISDIISSNKVTFPLFSLVFRKQSKHYYIRTIRTLKDN